MWNSIQVDKNDYIIRSESITDHHKVMLSDFVTIWYEEITSTALFERCKQLNPLMDSDQETLVFWTLSLLKKNSSSSAKMHVRQCGDVKFLEINSKLAGIPFVFKFHLSQLPAQELYNELTLPLLLMVQQMRAERIALIDLLRKKDTEILQYKLEGAQLSSKNSETGEFDEKKFENLCKKTEIPVQVAKRPIPWFTQELQGLYVEVLEKHKDVRAAMLTSDEKADETDSATQSSQSEELPAKKQKKSPDKWERLYATQNSTLEAKTEASIKVKKEESQQNEQILPKKRKEIANMRKLRL